MTGDAPDEHDALLASCYSSSLDLALANDTRTIAFPNISTGVYRFPKPRAVGVAVPAVLAWIAAHPGAIDSVQFACFDDENLGLYTEHLRRAAEGVGTA